MKHFKHKVGKVVVNILMTITLTFCCLLNYISIHVCIHKPILVFDAFHSKLQIVVHVTPQYFRMHIVKCSIFKVKFICSEMNGLKCAI